MAFVQIGNRGFNSDNITAVVFGEDEEKPSVAVYDPADDETGMWFYGDEYHAFMRWWQSVRVQPETWPEKK